MQPDQCVAVAHVEVEKATNDLVQAKEALYRIEEGEQVAANLLGFLRDARASLDTTYHAVAVKVIDQRLRDTDLVDGHGVVFRYRGADVGGLKVANIAGEFRHALRIVELTSDGFRAERDRGPAEKFAYKTREV